MEILGAFMVPHPPLIVEEIGKDEIEQIKKKVNAKNIKKKCEGDKNEHQDFRLKIRTEL